MKRALHLFAYTAGYALVCFLVVAAIALTAARLLLPHAYQYTQYIEQLLSETLKTQVRIGHLDADWYRYGPQLVVQDLRVLDALGQQEIGRIKQARLSFDIGEFVRSGTFGIGGVAISGIHLIVERSADGLLRIAGLGNSTDSAIEFDGAWVKSWLFGQLQWQVDDSSLEWRDLASDAAVSGDAAVLRFAKINLRLRNNGAQHRLEGGLSLPGILGESVAFAVDIMGDPLQPSAWTGRSYLESKKIQLAGLVSAWEGSSVTPIKNGLVDVQLWSRWEQGLSQVSGKIAGRELNVAAIDDIGPRMSITKAETQLQWLRNAKGWALNLDKLAISREGRNWPDSRARIMLTHAQAETPPVIDAQFDFIRLEDVIEAAATFPDLDSTLREFFMRAQPRGDVRDVTLAYHLGTAQPQYQISADVLGLRMLPWRSLPGFTGVAGSLVADAGAGMLDLNARSATIDFPKIFRTTLPLGSVHGQVAWNYNTASGAWRVASEELTVRGPDADVLASVDISAPDTQTPPYLDLVATYKDGDGRRTSRYLPTAIMSPQVVTWLDTSIKGGQITQGGVVVHGRVDRFPFAQGDGRFEVRGHIKEGVLHYLPDWPSIDNIDAELIFAGSSMVVRGNSAQILSSALTDVYATIPDMASEYSILTIAGNVAGESKDPLAFLQIVPLLNDLVGRNLSDLIVQGRSDLHLDLAIPLGKSVPGSTHVSAYAKLHDNTLNLGEWGQLLSHVNGTLAVDNDGIRGERIAARVLDQVATLDIKTLPGASGSEGAQVQIKSRGTLAPGRLVARFKPEWSDYFQGEGRWQANLKLPLNSSGSNVKKLRVEASWDDVSVRLPAPLGKPKGEILFVEVNADIENNEQKLLVHYGNRLNAALQLVSEQNQVSVARGEVRFGEGRAVLPKQLGLRVSGNLEQFSYDDWRAVAGLNAYFHGGGTTTPGGSGQKPLLYDLDVHTRRLAAFGQPFSDAHVKVVRGAKEWRTNVDSRELVGQVRIPFEMSQAPVLLDLKHWHYTPSEGKASSTLDPRTLPAMEIKSDKFVYGKVDFGSLQLKASKFAFGWRVDKLEMIAPLTMVNGSGAWNYDGKQHQSSFDLDVISEDVGATMSTFGYADSVAGGKGRVNLQAAWSAPMPAVTPEIIDGKLSLEFRQGRMLDVNPGAGRMFALLSIQALPRRLALDFSDLFAKGFAFDDLKGEFRLEHGEAYTSNLAMDGPAAKVRVAGRVGLADRDYDQVVRVIPELTSSVSVLTALAFPPVGVATYVLGKIFQTQIDAVTGVDYTIKGSWDSPQVERVSAVVDSQPTPVD